MKSFTAIVGTAQQEAPDYPQEVGNVPKKVSELLAGAKLWSANDDIFFGAHDTHATLPPGAYECCIGDQIGPYLKRLPIQVDDLLELPDSASEEVLKEFDRFWELKSAFSDRGFIHKRGIMLWGPPGAGKTSAIQLMARSIIQKQEGVVIYAGNAEVTALCLKLVRKIEQHRPLILVFEDIDALIRINGEHSYLALLDGEAQVGGLVSIATTNYPERLDKRFVDRPSRFDTIKYIGMPSAAARHEFLRVKEPSLSELELKQWVKKSEGFSLAHLKEMIIAVKCFGQALNEVVDRMEEMRTLAPDSEKSPDRQVVGF